MWCPVSDHDGAKAPVTRSITAIKTMPRSGRRHIHRRLCEWCAEAAVANMLREGYTVTISPVRPE